MAPFLFNLSAGLFWLFFLVRLWLWFRPQARLDGITAGAEKLGYILFTVGLALYIYYFRADQDSWLVQSLSFKKPVSWLLFTWSIYSCQIFVEIFYSFRLTAV